MSLVITEHLSLLMQVFKNLLSKKADKTELNMKANKTELDMKIDRSEIPNALEFAIELELISPVAAEDGAVYTDENGILYSL